MQNISPAALQGCLIVLQVVGLAGVWAMRITERSDLAHSLRGLVTLTMILLGCGIAVALCNDPRSAIVAGAVLAVIAVTAVADFNGHPRR